MARPATDLGQGSPEAARQFVEQFYPELRRMAAARMQGERAAHTWQPTVLVHELYLELVKVRALGARGDGDEQERAAFFGLAGQMMRRLLIRHARSLYRQSEHVDIADAPEVNLGGTDAVHDVEDALTRLAAINPRFRTVVEMKVFEGLTGEEIARQLDCSPRTVAACWSFARRWLCEEWAGARPL